MSSGLACTSSVDLAPPVLDLDLDRVGIVGQLPRDVLDHGAGRAPTMRLPSAAIRDRVEVVVVLGRA